MPILEEGAIPHNLSPNECRIRDLTYSAPIFVDVEYTKNN
jgi:DNA-directed RNA polymerase III subunit RPC2